MGTEYVQHRDGNIYVGPSRVTIDSVVIHWRNGQTPEQIHESFPTVPLANIYGAIAYYLEHQDEINEWIREGQEIFERERLADRAARPEWYTMMRARFAEARKRLGMSDEGERDADIVGENPQAPTPAASNE
ncbi:MAG TPA: DUF433 domain-containing protein [Ktedonobacterales bacterium]